MRSGRAELHDGARCGAKVSGHATAPGKLTLGVLLPVPGTWRLFLQMKLGGRVVTVPYTLKVGA